MLARALGEISTASPCQKHAGVWHLYQIHLGARTGIFNPITSQRALMHSFPLRARRSGIRIESWKKLSPGGFGFDVGCGRRRRRFWFHIHSRRLWLSYLLFFTSAGGGFSLLPYVMLCVRWAFRAFYLARRLRYRSLGQETFLNRALLYIREVIN